MSERTDHSIWPSITCDDARATRAWLVALGFAEGVCVTGEQEGMADRADEIMHSELFWPEGGRLMLSTRHAKPDGTFEVPRGSASIYVVTDGPGSVWAKAQTLGATVVRPLEEADYGSLGFSVADSEGNTYSFGTYAGG